jgi:hypothetical protein
MIVSGCTHNVSSHVTDFAEREAQPAHADCSSLLAHPKHTLFDRRTTDTKFGFGVGNIGIHCSLL